MSRTRSASRREALERVLQDVLEVDKDDPLRMSIEYNGFTSISDIMALSEVDICGLK